MRIDSQLLNALPKGTISMLMQLPAAKGVRKAILADFGIPDEILGHVGLTPEFDTRDTERALESSGIAVPPLESYAAKLWDYWERNLDPDLFKDRSFEGAVKHAVLITGASSGIGRAAAFRSRAPAGPLLVTQRRQAPRDQAANRGPRRHRVRVLGRRLRPRVCRRPRRQRARRPRRRRRARQQRRPLDPSLRRALIRPLP